MSTKARSQQNMPLVEFDDLNNDCIRLILLNFSISELLFLRATCPRWRDVIEVIFRSRHSLKLFANVDTMVGYFKELIRYNIQDDPYYCLEKNDPDELIGRRIDAPPVIHIGENDELPPAQEPLRRRPSTIHFPRLFPGITKLIMVIDESRNIPTQYMLNHWTELQELTIFNLARPPAEPSPWCRYFSTAISQMQNLRRLEIFHFDLTNPQRVNPLKPAMGRLERFAAGDFQGVDTANCLTSLLMELNPGRIRDLMLCRVNFELEQFRRFFEQKPEIQTRLTRLTFDIDDTRTRQSGDTLDYICKNFPALTFLQHSHISVGEIHEDIFPRLSLLRNLTEYKLFWHITERRLQDGATTPLENRTPILRMAMPSVRKLQLNLSRIVAHEPVTLFADFFPALEEFTICSLSPLALEAMPPDNKTIQQQFPMVTKWNLYTLVNSDAHFFGPFEHRQFTQQNEQLIRFAVQMVGAENRRRLSYSFVDIRDMMREQLHAAIGRNMDILFADIQNVFLRHFREVRLNPRPPPPEYRPRLIPLLVRQIGAESPDAPNPNPGDAPQPNHNEESLLQDSLPIPNIPIENPIRPARLPVHVPPPVDMLRRHPIEIPLERVVHVPDEEAPVEVLAEALEAASSADQ